MIPLRDTIPSNRAPWVMRILLAANIILFFVELGQGPALESFLTRFAVIPSAWTEGIWAWPRHAWTLLSSQFLHGGLLHLVSNMLYLWIFADNVEDRLGHLRFLGLYLGSGIMAALSQIVVSSSSSVPMIGASGAIAGVLGAYLLLFPGARVVTLVPLGWFWETIEVPAILFLGFWFVLQWLQGLTTIGQVASGGGVAVWAHIGGFISGMIGALLLRPSRHW